MYLNRELQGDFDEVMWSKLLHFQCSLQLVDVLHFTPLDPFELRYNTTSRSNPELKTPHISQPWAADSHNPAAQPAQPKPHTQPPHHHLQHQQNPCPDVPSMLALPSLLPQHSQWLVFYSSTVRRRSALLKRTRGGIANEIRAARV